jgi:hypothetical protein
MAEITIYWPHGRKYRIQERRAGRTLAEDPEQTLGERIERSLVVDGNVTVDEIKAAAIYEGLASCRTPKDAKKFAEKFGLLRHKRVERIDDFLADARVIRNLLAAAKEAKKMDEWESIREELSQSRPKIDYVLGEDDVGRPMPDFRATDLFSFIVMQLVGDYTGGKKYLRCQNPNCNRDPFFYIGPGTDRRARRKGQPAYCSPTCRAAHAYQKRKEPSK